MIPRHLFTGMIPSPPPQDPAQKARTDSPATGTCGAIYSKVARETTSPTPGSYLNFLSVSHSEYSRLTSAEELFGKEGAKLFPASQKKRRKANDVVAVEDVG